MLIASVGTVKPVAGVLERIIVREKEGEIGCIRSVFCDLMEMEAH